MSKSKIEWTQKVWKVVPNYDDYYVSNDGKVLSIKNGTHRVMKQRQNKDGHLYVWLYDGQGNQKKMYVHRLVLMAWVGLPQEGQECRHLNDIPTDNRLENLTWGSRLENVEDKRRNGGMRYGVNAPIHKLNDKKVIDIRKRYAMGESARNLAKENGVAHNTILTIVKGNKWKHLPTFPILVKHSSAPITPISELHKEKCRQNIKKAIEARRAHRIYSIVPCACGCGEMIITPDSRGRERKYIHGHYNYWKHGTN